MIAAIGAWLSCRILGAHEWKLARGFDPEYGYSGIVWMVCIHCGKRSDGRRPIRFR